MKQLTTAPKRRGDECGADAGLPETLGLYVVSGSEDFLIHVAVADNQDLYAFVIDRLTQCREVVDVRTSVVYEHLRNARIEPQSETWRT